MPLARPGGQDEQQPGIAVRADLVALGGVEHREQARSTGHAVVARDEIDLPIHDDQVGALVDLMVLKRLARGQVQATVRASPREECRISGS